MNNPNLEMLEAVVKRLGKLADEMVFLGGCATGLLITDSAAPPIRVTRDVDAITQLLSLTDYYQLSGKLRKLGFTEDTRDDAPICRWLAENIVLDIMPTHEEILGFGNQWYTPALIYAQKMVLPSGKTIHSVTAPYFLITKLEAFEGRGKGDFLLSHDIEDLIAVLDGRQEVIQDVMLADKALVSELSKRFDQLMNNSHFINAVYGHMPTDAISQQRVETVLQTIKEIIKQG